MLAPVVFDATGPMVANAVERSRVVVVLPFVPLTITVRRSRVSRESRRGSIIRAVRPPITLPEPKRMTLEMVAASRPAARATRARIGSDDRPDREEEEAGSTPRGLYRGVP